MLFSHKNEFNSHGVGMDLRVPLSLINFLLLRFRKAGRVGEVAHERLTEPHVTMEWLLAIPRGSSNLPGFLDLIGRGHFTANNF